MTLTRLLGICRGVLLGLRRFDEKSLNRGRIVLAGFVGDIALNGLADRKPEPIGRQAKTVAATILSQASVPYSSTRVPLRIKTSSLPFTV